MKRSAIVFVVGRMRMKMKMKMTMKMSFWRRCSQSVQDRFCGVAERQGQGGRVVLVVGICACFRFFFVGSSIVKSIPE